MASDNNVLLQASAVLQWRLPMVFSVWPDFEIKCKWQRHTWSKNSPFLVISCDFVSSEIESETILIVCPIFYRGIKQSDSAVALLGHGKSTQLKFISSPNIVMWPNLVSVVDNC